MTFETSCGDCGAAVAPDDGRALAAQCGGLLDYHYDLAGVALDEGQRSIWRYRDLLPVPAGVAPVTLGEGLTPLIRARLDVGAETWWKNESGSGTVRPGDVVVGVVGGNGFRELGVLAASTASGARFLSDGDAIAFLASLA